MVAATSKLRVPLTVPLRHVVINLSGRAVLPAGAFAGEKEAD
jgi:hypothetical protein